jgi:uncharacterized DUF497 family protein
MPPPFRSFFRTFEVFEWDPAKSDRCFAERGFDFRVASGIFSRKVVRRRDTRERREVRFQAIGEVGELVLFVVYTVRAGRCRILSARHATPDEVQVYRER